jgi:hypothetical protein
MPDRVMALEHRCLLASGFALLTIVGKNVSENRACVREIVRLPPSDTFHDVA